METFDLSAFTRFVLGRLKPKEFGRLENELPAIVEAFARYDMHFMRLTGVLDDEDVPTDIDYDEDDAFEYIYDAYLNDHPEDEDGDMLAASLLNRYMEIKDDYPQL